MSLAEKVQVTVMCMCYNHERYLKECLDSIIGQQTNFPFLVIVHDDASTDRSAEIIREYEQNYPGILKGIYQKQNLYSQKGFQGIASEMLKQCHGKYLAFCECDDYWVDSYKLQKQYDAMERNQAVFCTHQVRRVMEDGTPTGKILPSDKTGFVKSSSDFIKTIFTHENPNCFVYQASSYFMRRDIAQEEKPEFMKLCCVGDVPLVLYYASKGKAVYIPEELSCYRIMSDSSWNKAVKKDVERQIQVQQNMVECFKAYKEYTQHAYDILIDRKIMEIELGILVLSRKFSEIRKRLFQEPLSYLPIKKWIKFWLYGHCSKLMEWYDNQKGKGEWQ